MSYIAGHRRRTTAATSFAIGQEAITTVSLQETTQYLGSAIGIVGTKRMRNSIALLQEAKEDAALISTSCLKENQIVDAIRCFTLPRLEYALMSGTTQEEDQRARHANWGTPGQQAQRGTSLGRFPLYRMERRGLSLLKLEERQAELTLDTYVRLYDSNKEQTRNIFRHWRREVCSGTRRQPAST